MKLGVDIGGTKTLVATFDESGNIVNELVFHTPDQYNDFLEEFSRTIAKLSVNELEIAAIAVPARLDRQRGVAIAFGNLPWENVPILVDCKKILGCPAIIENDTKLAGLSEALLVSNDYQTVLYLTVSTGINGALIIDGRIDPHFADMEAGQLLLEYEGVLKDWEDFASGKAFQKKFNKQVSETNTNDSEAWYWLSRNLAIGLVDLAATLTPEVIIIGGGVGAHLEKFQDRLEEELKIYENPMFRIPPIMKAKRPDKAVIYGCFEYLKGKD